MYKPYSQAGLCIIGAGDLFQLARIVQIPDVYIVCSFAFFQGIGQGYGDAASVKGADLLLSALDGDLEDGLVADGFSLGRGQVRAVHPGDHIACRNSCRGSPVRDRCSG